MSSHFNSLSMKVSYPLLGCLFGTWIFINEERWAVFLDEETFSETRFPASHLWTLYYVCLALSSQLIILMKGSKNGEAIRFRETSVDLIVKFSVTLLKNRFRLIFIFWFVRSLKYCKNPPLWRNLKNVQLLSLIPLTAQLPTEFPSTFVKSIPPNALIKPEKQACGFV